VYRLNLNHLLIRRMIHCCLSQCHATHCRQMAIRHCRLIRYLNRRFHHPPVGSESLIRHQMIRCCLNCPNRYLSRSRVSRCHQTAIRRCRLIRYLIRRSHHLPVGSENLIRYLMIHCCRNCLNRYLSRSRVSRFRQTVIRNCRLIHRSIRCLGCLLVGWARTLSRRCLIRLNCRNFQIRLTQCLTRCHRLNCQNCRLVD